MPTRAEVTYGGTDRRTVPQGLRDGLEVWLEGERVEDVTTDPKMARMAKTLAGIYDLQHSPEHHEK